MKKIYSSLSSLILSAFFTVHSVQAVADDSCRQRAISADVIAYSLVNCPHHHTVSWVQNVLGTNNYNAGIEGGGVAKVYVADGIVIGHSDSGGYFN